MAATGNQTSLRKRDLTTQKSPAVAYNALVFQHKAAAGDTGINLAALNTPTEASSNGFVQPSAQRLADAQLKRNPNVLKLISSSGTVLQPYVSFRVTGNLQIQFIGFTALQDEIFTGYIDPVAVTGATIADISAEPITGTLAANTTDINVGYQFKVNLHSSQQVGQYSLEIDGVGQFRNENNSSTGTGNYYEVDNGDGTGTLLRVNTAATYDRSYKLIPIGSVLERPAGSVLQAIDQQNGVIQKLVEVVADLSGLEETSLTASPTSPDLSAFGNRVLAVEQNRARKDLSNTWTAAQTLLGKTDGVAIPAGSPGQVLQGQILRNNQVTLTAATFTSIMSVTLPPGVWLLSAGAAFVGTATNMAVPRVEIVRGTPNVFNLPPDGVGLGFDCSGFGAQGPINISEDYVNALPPCVVNIPVSTTYYLTFYFLSATGAVRAYGRIQGLRLV